MNAVSSSAISIMLSFVILIMTISGYAVPNIHYAATVGG